MTSDAELLPPLEPYGRALWDYFRGDHRAVLEVQHSLDGPARLDAEVFFRAGEELLEFEQLALELCRGTVVDIGAGAGVHSVPLQERGFEVVAVEPVAQAAEILRRRGVRTVFESGIEEAQPQPADTVLLLMNGTGIAGTLRGLGRLFSVLRAWVAPGGAILIDSTDPALTAEAGQEYAGEAWIQLAYRGARGRPYRELYCGAEQLERAARPAGWRMQVVFEEADGTFLARLTHA